VGSQVGALNRHIALIGFMGAGKTTVGREVARLTERLFVDVDEEIVARHGPIPDLFEAGEPGFRRIEERVVAEALVAREPRVVALGGGALGSEATRRLLRETAFTILLSVEVEEAWRRVRASDRPLAQSEDAFRRLYEARQPDYRETADAVAHDLDGVLLAALRVEVRSRAVRGLSDVLPGERSVALVVDEHVADLHRPSVDERFSVHLVPRGERAKTTAVAERLWRDLRVERDALLAVLGGGSTTDVAGFVAATYLRGVCWVAVPTTLVGQVDAAIGGKTGIDLPEGKNLVGAFHVPVGVVLDPGVLGTLPENERRNGLAEVVKTGLLAGRPLWDLPEEEMVRACAAFKCAVVISDPLEHGRRAILNLGHTFAHALEASSDYTVSHGDAVALGLLAALRLSGQPTDVVAELLRPEPVRVDRERAWAALGRDKKATGGRTRLVLLRRPGEPEYGVELPDGDVRAALNELIRQ
jgi:shikimate kinase / 3-dehydroquinate synthase